MRHNLPARLKKKKYDMISHKLRRNGNMNSQGLVIAQYFNEGKLRQGQEK